jgi:predicted RNA methylase
MEEQPAERQKAALPELGKKRKRPEATETGPTKKRKKEEQSMREKLKVVSLFCGAGGLDLGFKMAGGFSIVAAIDSDEHAVASYRRNIGEHVRAGDVRKLRAADLPACDVLIGGPPW